MKNLHIFNIENPNLMYLTNYGGVKGCIVQKHFSSPVGLQKQCNTRNCRRFCETRQMFALGKSATKHDVISAKDI